MKKNLQGLGVSMGRVEGKVCIIKTWEDGLKLRDGEILVTRMTDPTMVPAMAKAKGIICEIGGMTSHPAIVSRELGIPCIVAAKKATEILKSGMEIMMDGQSGEIHVK